MDPGVLVCAQSDHGHIVQQNRAVLCVCLLHPVSVRAQGGLRPHSAAQQGRSLGVAALNLRDLRPALL